MNKKGSAMILVTFVVMILFMMGTAFFEISRTEQIVANNQKDEVSAYYIAEAGMKKALATVQNWDAAKLSTLETMTLNQTVKVIDNENFGAGFYCGKDTENNPQPIMLKITKAKDENGIVEASISDTGICITENNKKAKKNLEVKIKINFGTDDNNGGGDDGGNGGGSSYSFPTNGVIISNNNISLYKDTTVNGDLYAKYNITFGKNCTINGLIHKNEGNNLIPVVTSDMFTGLASLPSGWDGDLSKLTGGSSYYTTGNINIFGTYTGKIAIVTLGQVSMDKDTDIFPAGNNFTDNSLSVIAFNGISISKDGNINGVFFAAGGSISVKKTIQFRGALLSKDGVSSSKAGTYTYNHNLVNSFMDFIGSFNNDDVEEGNDDPIVDVMYWK